MREVDDSGHRRRGGGGGHRDLRLARAMPWPRNDALDRHRIRQGIHGSAIALRRHRLRRCWWRLADHGQRRRCDCPSLEGAERDAPDVDAQQAEAGGCVRGRRRTQRRRLCRQTHKRGRNRHRRLRAASCRVQQPQAPAVATQQPGSPGKVYAGPAVRRLAREMGVDLERGAKAPASPRPHRQGRRQGAFVKRALTAQPMQGPAPPTANGGRLTISRFGEVDEACPLTRMLGSAARHEPAPGSWQHVVHVTAARRCGRDRPRRLPRLAARRSGAATASSSRRCRSSSRPASTRCAEHPRFNASLERHPPPRSSASATSTSASPWTPRTDSSCRSCATPTQLGLFDLAEEDRRACRPRPRARASLQARRPARRQLHHLQPRRASAAPASRRS